MVAVPVNGSHLVYLSLFLLVEAIPVSRSHSFSGNHFLSVDVFPFSVEYSCKWKLLLLEEVLN